MKTSRGADLAGTDRRTVLKTGLIGAAAASTALTTSLLAKTNTNSAGPSGIPASTKKKSKANILFFLTDQQHINTFSAGGNPYVSTAHMDRLYNAGVRFSESFCTNPVCIPARSSLFTGRMPTETGNWFNSARSGQIEQSIPTVGELLRDKAGYDAVYAGKWHVTECHTYDIRGFKVLSTGLLHWGDFSDELVSRACASYLDPGRKGSAGRAGSAGWPGVASSMRATTLSGNGLHRRGREWLAAAPAQRARALAAVSAGFGSNTMQTASHVGPKSPKPIRE